MIFFSPPGGGRLFILFVAMRRTQIASAVENSIYGYENYLYVIRVIKNPRGQLKIIYPFFREKRGLSYFGGHLQEPPSFFYDWRSAICAGHMQKKTGKMNFLNTKGG